MILVLKADFACRRMYISALGNLQTEQKGLTMENITHQRITQSLTGKYVCVFIRDIIVPMYLVSLLDGSFGSITVM